MIFGFYNDCVKKEEITRKKERKKERREKHTILIDFRNTDTKKAPIAVIDLLTSPYQSGPP